MAEILEQKSSFGAKKEVTYGTDPTMDATNMIEFLKGSNFPSYAPEAQERNIVRNTFSKLSAVRGAELNVDGSVSIELHGSGTAGAAPESDPLWECAIGVSHASVATTVATGTSTTVFDVQVGAGVNFQVGDAVLVDIGGTKEISWITSVATDTITVSPAFSQTPATSAAVGASVNYKLKTPGSGVVELSSFFASLWRGDAYRYDLPGCKVSKLAFNFSTGEIITPQFDFTAKNTVVPAAQANPFTPAYDSANADALVAVNMGFTIDGTTYDVSNCALELNNELHKRQAITTSGISKALRTGRGVSGSFSLLYEDTAIETAFRNDTRGELIVVAGATPGNIFAIKIPRVRYTETPVSVTDGIYQYDIGFDAELTNGDDEITAVSFM